MLSRHARKLIAKTMVTAIITSSSIGLLPAIEKGLNLESTTVSVKAAEVSGSVTVTADSLWTYSQAAWSSRYKIVSKGNVFQVVEKITVEGREMFRMDSGIYITANPLYVSANITASTPAPAPTPAPVPTGTYKKTTVNLHMRTGAATTNASIMVLPAGTVVEVIGSANGWDNIVYGGKTGWSSNQYLTPVQPPAPVPVPEPVPVTPEPTPTPVPEPTPTPVPEPTPAPVVTYMKTTATLNMRTGVGTGFPSIGTIPAGMVVEAKESSGGWYKVVYNGKEGWSSGTYLVSASAPSAPAPAPIPTVTMTYARTLYSLNMRTGPGTGYAIVATLPAGTSVPVSNYDNGWYRTTYAGKTGYIAAAYVTSSYSQVMNIPFISQLTPVYAPIGCEPISVLMGLRYKGYAKDTGIKQYLDNMPYHQSNPALGFVGTPYGADEPTRRTTIYPSALAQYANQYANGAAADISGASVDDLIKEVLAGNPVMPYLTEGVSEPVYGTFVIDGVSQRLITNNHVVVISGYNAETQQFTLVDPWSKSGSPNIRTMSKAFFTRIYDLRRHAVVIR